MNIVAVTELGILKIDDIPEVCQRISSITLIVNEGKPCKLKESNILVKCRKGCDVCKERGAPKEVYKNKCFSCSRAPFEVIKYYIENPQQDPSRDPHKCVGLKASKFEYILCYLCYQQYLAAYKERLEIAKEAAAI